MVVMVWLVLFFFNVFYFFEMKLVFGNYCVWVFFIEGDVRKGVVLVEFFGKFFIFFVVMFLFFLSFWMKVKDLLVLF